MKSPSYPFLKTDQSSTATLVVGKGTALTTMEVQNINTSDVFIQIFDAVAAADVSVGTTVAKQSYVIPASDGANRSASSKDWGDRGLMFTNGIVIAITTTVGGSTAPATACVVNMTYA